MITYFIGYIVTYLSALVSLDKHATPKVQKVILTTVFCVLFLFCALRGDIDRDHQNYINISRYIVNGVNYLIEPSFYLFTYISEWASGGPVLIFIMYAMLAIILKFHIIKKYSLFPLISLLIYFCNYYFLHEMTQVRIGVSIAFAIISLYYWTVGVKRYYYIYLFIAFLFHYSSLVFLIVHFLPNKKIKNKELIIYFAVIAASYVLYFLHLGMASLFSYIPIGFVQEKFSSYSQKLELGNVVAVNVFSSMQLIKLFVITVISIYIPESIKKNNFFNLMFRFYIYSCICWVLFFDIPVFAIRLSELFGFAEIFILPCLILLSRNKMVGLVLITVLSVFIFYVNIFHNQLVLPYNVFWD